MSADEYRDRIAEGVALAMVEPSKLLTPLDAELVAGSAYAVADAMWKRREQGKAARGEYDEPALKEQRF